MVLEEGHGVKMVGWYLIRYCDDQGMNIGLIKWELGIGRMKTMPALLLVYCLHSPGESRYIHSKMPLRVSASRRSRMQIQSQDSNIFENSVDLVIDYTLP